MNRQLYSHGQTSRSKCCLWYNSCVFSVCVSSRRCYLYSDKTLNQINLAWKSLSAGPLCVHVCVLKSVCVRMCVDAAQPAHQVSCWLFVCACVCVHVSEGNLKRMLYKWMSVQGPAQDNVITTPCNTAWQQLVYLSVSPCLCWSVCMCVWEAWHDSSVSPYLHVENGLLYSLNQNTNTHFLYSSWYVQHTHTHTCFIYVPS